MTSPDPTAGTVLGEEARAAVLAVLKQPHVTVVPVDDGRDYYAYTDRDKQADALLAALDPHVAALLADEREAGREEGRREAAKAMRDPVRRMTAALIAVDSRLTEPYPDDPRWTPWTRFIEPALRELRAAAIYNRMAAVNGWAIQESTRVDFDELPDANRRTMIATEKTRLEAGVNLPGPAVLAGIEEAK